MEPKKFHKYLKMFEKKDLERMSMRKPWDHTIDLRERSVLRKGKVYPLSRIKREKTRIFEESVEKKVYSTIQVTVNIISVLCAK